LDRFQYSNSAINTISKFHRKNNVIYVEGQDDLVFWDKVFNHYKLPSFKIKIAGGKNESKSIIRSIIKNDVNIIVAMDSDYTCILGYRKSHPRILYTYGYSIENTIFSPHSISSLIKNFSRSQIDLKTLIEEWCENLCKSVYKLMLYDVANIKFKKGLNVLDCSVCRFLVRNNSHQISESKVKDFCDNLKNSFTDDEIDYVKLKFDKCKVDLKYIIRGHFLTPAIINYIKYQVKSQSGRKISISKESLFAHTVDIFLIDDSKNPDIKFLNKQIKCLKESIYN